MARPARFFLPGQPQHVTQRGNNRSPVFFGDGDRVFYLECLRDACGRYGCAVHAYVLMTNHVHLLMSPATADALPRTMQSVGRRYAGRVNWRQERSGTLWEARYRAAAIDSDRYFFTCSRYIELNPVRAGMVGHPAEYAWSSFKANVCGTPDPLVSPHELYLSLGATGQARREAYQALFAEALDAVDLDRLREATLGGWPVGSDHFLDQLAGATGRRTRRMPRGRKIAGLEGGLAVLKREAQRNQEIDSDTNWKIDSDTN